MTSLAAQEIAEFVTIHRIINPPEDAAPPRPIDSAEEMTDDWVKRGWLTAFQKTELLAGHGTKLLFGPYRLLEPLGEGGMGMVFKARHSRLDRIVALKFIHPELLASQPHALQRFNREAKVIAQLNHPNIVTLFDSGEIAGTPYIAMEFVGGKSLWEMVQNTGPLPVRQACDYICQTASALQHASECGIVHRDIKPSNLLVSDSRVATQQRTPTQLKRLSLVTVQDRERVRKLETADVSQRPFGEVKILDMGLACLKQSLREDKSQSALTQIGDGILGTPDFISPEQARDPRNVDIRADLYSLGCTFYYVLSGQFPFPDGTAIEKILHHQQSTPRPIRELRRDLPYPIVDIVNRLMEKKAEDRIQKPSDLAAALASCLKAVRSPEMVAAVDAPIGNSWQVDPWEGEVRPAPAREETPLLVHTRISLDSERDASQSDTARPDLKTLNLRGEIRPSIVAKRHHGLVTAVTLTPDGCYAATGDVNGGIRIWDLTLGEPKEFAALDRSSEIQTLAFAPRDPNCLIYGELQRGKGSLQRWDWSENHQVDWTTLTGVDQNGVNCVGFSSDGKTLAAAFGTVLVTYRVKDRELSNRVVLKNLGIPVRTLALSPEPCVLVAAGQSNFLHCWDLNRRGWNGKSVKETNIPAAGIAAMSFSPDGKWLAVGGLDARAALWDLSNRAKPQYLEGHKSNLIDVRFSADGEHLITISRGGEIFYWQLSTGNRIQELKVDLNLAYHIAISEAGTRLVAGYSSGQLAFWNLPEWTR